jgi:2-polyprenyl-3-methyl-5-hydroxy-6-metoxy-1,4-benzoquinol methylase
MTEATTAIDFPDCLREDFPRELPFAVEAVDRVLDTLPGRHFEELARHSPSLARFDWATYLRCSIARMVHAAASVERRGLAGGRVLDYGSYFGNFALMFRRLGFDVDAIDDYRAYSASMAASADLLRGAGVHVLDFGDVGFDLGLLESDRYDLIVCGGVIEHVPHTPRPLLAALDRALGRDGLLVIDTPNLAYLNNRQRLARGESVMADLAAQFHTALPFRGHHREYVPSELVWMLGEIGHHDVSIELFNYSVYGCTEVYGRDVDNLWAMTAEPSLRELMMSTSRKPGPGTTRTSISDWRSVYEEPEQVWRRRLAAAGRPQSADANTELTLVRLQQEVDLRDRLLAETSARLQQEVDRRDRLLAELQAERNEAVATRDDLIRELEANRAREVASRDATIAALSEKVDRILAEHARLSRALAERE